MIAMSPKHKIVTNPWYNTTEEVGNEKKDREFIYGENKSP